MSTPLEEENAILAQANAIIGRTFREAEAKWAATPDADKQRPWPRCHSLDCNRTLVCLEQHNKPCQGWDF